MTASKTALTSSAIAFALLFGGGAYLVMNLNLFAKPFTEKLASKALGVAVVIGEMDIALQQQKVTVQNIKVKNPAGFKNTDIITIKQIDIKLNSVAEKLINFKAIDITGANVNLEVTQNTTNLGTLKKKIAESQKNEQKPEKPIKVIIDKFTMTGNSLTPSVTLLSHQNLKPIKVSNIGLKNIGKKEGGIEAQETISQITRHIINVSSQSANKAGFYEGLSAQVLRELGISQIETLKNQISDEINKIGDSIQKLFK